MEYNDYGPGDNFTINTLKEFHVRIEFKKYGDEFGAFLTTMSQNDKSVETNGDCADYNKLMTNDLKNGMAFAFSSWSTMDNWLWGDRCQAAECTSKNLYIKNINITTGSDKPGPTPPGPKPSDCDNCQYGGECATRNDDECVDCDCHWSWPSSESYDGPDAKCRCKV